MLLVLVADQFIEAFNDVTKSLTLLSVDKRQRWDVVADESGPNRVIGLIELTNETSQPGVAVGKPTEKNNLFRFTH